MPFQKLKIKGGTVDVVRLSVPSLSRDAFFWPCIAGEQFPPTFNNSAGYGSFGDSPTVFANVGGPQTASDVFWPNLPRTGAGDKNTVTVSGRLLFDVTSVDAGQWIAETFSVTPPGGTTPPYAQISNRSDLATMTVSIHSNTNGNASVNVAKPANDTWTDFAVVIHPDGTVDVFWNKLLVVSHLTEWLPGSDAVNMDMGCQSSAINQVGEIDVTQLQVGWS